MDGCGVGAMVLAPFFKVCENLLGQGKIAVCEKVSGNSKCAVVAVCVLNAASKSHDHTIMNKTMLSNRNQVQYGLQFILQASKTVQILRTRDYRRVRRNGGELW